ncbi:MAG TPA: R3H domain-containing nucleic acid-binding protein [Thermoanaerobaculia bacterium]|nr:R3H domain-containing nucleic acid-binding protein [Thermoanaerobaculia bacterium]
MKRVVIEADVNEAATVPAVAAPAVAAPPEQPLTRPAATLSSPAGRGNREAAVRGRDSRGGRGRRDDQRGRHDRNDRNDRPRRGRDQDDFQAADFAAVFDVPEQGAESEGAKSVREWCEQAMTLARLDLQLRSEENETQIIIRLYGRDARLMVDRHGELLDAVQVLTNKALTGRKIEKDIELDCQDVKRGRTEELEQKAKRLADEVRRDGREQLLPAMTPIERRIVHLALRDDGDVTTESRGDGFYKRIAIIRRPPNQEQPSAS